MKLTLILVFCVCTIGAQDSAPFGQISPIGDFWRNLKEDVNSFRKTALATYSNLKKIALAESNMDDVPISSVSAEINANTLYGTNTFTPSSQIIFILNTQEKEIKRIFNGIDTKIQSKRLTTADWKKFTANLDTIVTRTKSEIQPYAEKQPSGFQDKIFDRFAKFALDSKENRRRIYDLLS